MQIVSTGGNGFGEEIVASKQSGIKILIIITIIMGPLECNGLPPERFYCLVKERNLNGLATWCTRVTTPVFLCGKNNNH